MALAETFSRALLAVSLSVTPVAARAADSEPDPLAPSEPVALTHFSASTKTARMIDLDALTTGGNALETDLQAVTHGGQDDLSTTSGFLKDALAVATRDSSDKPIIAFSDRQRLAIMLDASKGVAGIVRLNGDPHNSLFWATSKDQSDYRMFKETDGALTEMKLGRADAMLHMMTIIRQADRDMHDGRQPPRPTQAPAPG